jgi:hypothetical protein
VITHFIEKLFTFWSPISYVGLRIQIVISVGKQMPEVGEIEKRSQFIVLFDAIGICPIQ